MWILLLFVVANSSWAQVILDYAGGPTQGDAWITLEIPGPEWEIHHVVWCKSLVPNDQQPAELPHDCVGRNLMRRQLYPAPPGSGPIMIRDADNPNRYYIDPANVGGWDSRHQWIIWMQLIEKEPAKSTMVEVIRFNAITALVTSTTSLATTSTQKEETTQPPSTMGEITSASIEEVITERPWLGFAIILGVGFVLIAATILTYRLMQRQGASSSRPYGPLLFWNSVSVRDEEEEDARLREEDLQILSKIGN